MRKLTQTNKVRYRVRREIRLVKSKCGAEESEGRETYGLALYCEGHQKCMLPDISPCFERVKRLVVQCGLGGVDDDTLLDVVYDFMD